MSSETALRPAYEIQNGDEPIRAVQRLQSGPPPVVFDDAQVRLIKDSIARDCNPQQFELFLTTCRRTGLDPFMKQIYPLVSQGKLSIITGIDGLRLIAARTGLLDGMEEPEWCGDDEEWRSMWVRKDEHGKPVPPAACRVTVHRKDNRRPFTATVMFREFGKNSNTWNTMPAHMLAVRAESHALRKAFPNEMANIRLAEDDEITTEPAPRPQARVTETPVQRAALNRGTASAPATPQPPGNGAQRRGAANGNVVQGSSPCGTCLAPAGKPHASNCPQKGGAAPSAPTAAGEDLTLQAPSSGSPASVLHDEARKRLFGAYRAAGGDTNDQAVMLRHCELILLECLGERHSFTSRTQLDVDQMGTCAEWLLQRQCLPVEPQNGADGGRSLMDQEDPFEDE